MDSKELLNQTLDFYKQKLNSDSSCTPEDIESLRDIFVENLEIVGTVEDISKFYNVPESSVRNLISRKVIEKPKRRVYYNFISLLKRIPDKWLIHKKLQK